MLSKISGKKSYLLSTPEDWRGLLGSSVKVVLRSKIAKRDKPVICFISIAHGIGATNRLDPLLDETKAME